MKVSRLLTLGLPVVALSLGSLSPALAQGQQWKIIDYTPYYKVSASAKPSDSPSSKASSKPSVSSADKEKSSDKSASATKKATAQPGKKDSPDAAKPEAGSEPNKSSAPVSPESMGDIVSMESTSDAEVQLADSNMQAQQKPVATELAYTGLEDRHYGIIMVALSFMLAGVMYLMASERIGSLR